MTNKIQEKLNQLLSEYAKNLPDKIQHLLSHWDRLKKNPTPKGMADFHREIHSLSGSSGTYGYRTLSHASRDIEKFVSDLIASDATVGPDEAQKISALLERLKPASVVSDTTGETGAFTFAISPTQLNKNIYLLTDNEEFAYELNERLVQTGYTIERQENLALLLRAVRTSAPLAVIVEMESLAQNELDHIADLRKRETAPISLLFISSHGDLVTRLRAVRAGGIGFYQIPVDWFRVSRMLDQLSESSTNEPYRILIVDDSQSIAQYHSFVLQEAGMITAIEARPLEIMKKIVDFQPDLLLMDIYMPECSGLEIAAVLRQQALYTSLPIVFLSTEDDRIKQLSALNIGGDDFLTKPVEPQHLISTVRSRAKRSGILSSFMMRDSMTNLLNHTTILQQLTQEIHRAERENKDLSLVILDIDHFKSINDTYGHPMGDHVLQKLAEVLLSQLRKTDIVGRYGGDEFAIILPNTDKTVSLQLCDRIRENFSQTKFKREGEEFPVSFSMGIASFPFVADANGLINAADKALYRAKNQGRNRIIHWENQ